MRKLMVALAALGLAAQAQAVNLVANGDFSGGNAGFTSSYNYLPYASNGNTADGQYTIGTNAFDWNPFFVSMVDHTTGNGNFMVVNGSSVANSIVWASGPIAVTSNTQLFFDAFVSNVCCNSNYSGVNSPPSLTFAVLRNDGSGQQNLDTLTLTIPPTISGQWYGLSNAFNTNSATSVSLFLLNANTNPQGNDFAVDDISLSDGSTVSVPEPMTWAMMVGGFGLMGTSMRRRRISTTLA